MLAFVFGSMTVTSFLIVCVVLYRCVCHLSFLLFLDLRCKASTAHRRETMLLFSANVFFFEVMFLDGRSFSLSLSQI